MAPRRGESRLVELRRVRSRGALTLARRRPLLAARAHNCDATGSVRVHFGEMRLDGRINRRPPGHVRHSLTDVPPTGSSPRLRPTLAGPRSPYEADAYINQLSHLACDPDPGIARATADWLLRHPTWPSEWPPHLVMMAHAAWMHTGDTAWLAGRFDALRICILEHRARPDGLVYSDKKTRKHGAIGRAANGTATSPPNSTPW